MFSFFKSLTAGKVVTKEGMAPILDKMKEHLISKNVAAAIADKLCTSVAAKLDGKVISNFTGELVQGFEGGCILISCGIFPPPPQDCSLLSVTPWRSPLSRS